uniref:TAFII28 domain-containing protein n=1 Tax=Caenorhabditis japonica TaxID=281687 RepID=A0A8R1IVV4_CAEJA
MSVNIEQDDLFGGVSDSDSDSEKNSDDEPEPIIVLQEMAMSSEDEEPPIVENLFTLSPSADESDGSDSDSGASFHSVVDQIEGEVEQKLKAEPQPEPSPLKRKLEISVPHVPQKPHVPEKLPTAKDDYSLTENTEEARRMKDLILLANLSKSQLERYEVYRRYLPLFVPDAKIGFLDQISKNPPSKKLIGDVTGTAPSDQLVLAIRSLTKMFVGDLVEEAVELREIQHEQDKPIQPKHIKFVFQELVEKGKLWPPYGSK